MESYDKDILNQVQATHRPDSREIRIKPLLHVLKDMLKHVLEDMLKHASPIPDAIEDPSFAAQAHTKAMQDSNLIAVLDELAPYVDQVTNKVISMNKINESNLVVITSKYSTRRDAHSTTMAILNMLNKFSWDTKLAIILEAFAMCCAKLLLMLQCYSSSPLAKYLAILDQMPGVLEVISTLKPRAEAIAELLKVISDIINCIIRLKDVPVQYIAKDFKALTTATEYIPILVYWTIRTIIVASLQIPFRVGMRKELTTSWEEVWDLGSLTFKLNKVLSHLQNQLNLCYQHADEKRITKSYQSLLRLFEGTHSDNMKVLRALFYSKGAQPLVHGVTKKMVTVDVLRRSFVLLLITELDIPELELRLLKNVYIESKKKNQMYEIVWLPILDTTFSWTDDKKKQFKKLQATMPWYTVYNPSSTDQAVNKLVKEKWLFGKKPILVVLDPLGQVASRNAFHMVWIWGCTAFPFTTLREEALWKGESWRLELLVGEIDLMILDWIKKEKYIFLYGGEDIEWIRRFTSSRKAVAQDIGVSLEMMYVGRSNPNERVKSIISTINHENLSHCWQDLTTIQFFWRRLESMMCSKIELGKTIFNDEILREVTKILDCGSTGWSKLHKGRI